jgi:hypothetical protein
MENIQYNLYPIISYNKYIGKPLYKFSRKKLHLGRSASLHIAKLPATIALFGLTGLTVSYMMDPKQAVILTSLGAIYSHADTICAFNKTHKKNKAIRIKNLEKIIE